MDKKYTLRYLPTFFDDLSEKVDYIAKKLKNKEAANHLVDEVEQAISERQPVCESFENYHSVKERNYPYYRIYVGNYIIYYVVIDHKIMEVRRFLYKGQDRESMV